MAVPEPCLNDVRAHAARLAPDQVVALVHAHAHAPVGYAHAARLAAEGVYALSRVRGSVGGSEGGDDVGMQVVEGLEEVVTWRLEARDRAIRLEEAEVREWRLAGLLAFLRGLEGRGGDFLVLFWGGEVGEVHGGDGRMGVLSVQGKRTVEWRRVGGWVGGGGGFEIGRAHV